MAYKFDGSTSVLQLNPLPPQIPVAAPMTLACRFKIASLGIGNRCVLSIGNNSAANVAELYITNTNFRSYWGGVGGNSGSVAGAPIINTWNSGVGIFVSNASRITCLNGVWAARDTGNVSISGVNTVLVGAEQWSSIDEFYSGLLADVAVWNTNLSLAEADAYCAGVPPDQISPQNLALYLPLERDIFDRSFRRSVLSNTAVIPVSDAPATPAMRRVLRSFPAVAGDTLFAGQCCE